MIPQVIRMSAPSRTTDQEVEALAGRLRLRDPQAMVQLYDLFSRRAFGLAYRVLGDGTDAEDVVQESFMALWRQADRIDPNRGRLTAYLLTIVHRRAIDALRARRRREIRTITLEPELDAQDTLDVEAAALASLDGARVRAHVEQLPPEQRRVIELAFFEGYTHAEIAQRLQLPLGTVKSRIRLGMEKLRDALRAPAVDQSADG